MVRRDDAGTSKPETATVNDLIKRAKEEGRSLGQRLETLRALRERGQTMSAGQRVTTAMLEMALADELRRAGTTVWLDTRYSTGPDGMIRTEKRQP